MPPLEKNEPSEMPIFEWAEIKKHDKEEDGWVVKDGQVFDVSKFLREHPGGASIVIPHLGTDIEDIFEDEDMHVHSAAAHNMLERYKIGLLSGSSAKATKAQKMALSVDFDWNKPIILQIGKLGNNYSKFIHTPQVLDEPARFFETDFCEFFSRTSWWVIPLVWVPVVCGLVGYAVYQGLAPLTALAIWLSGIFVWTFLEYALHRWLFHLDEIVEFSWWTITAHFLLHGVHHLLPMDPMRLVFPPVLTIILGVPFYTTFRLALDEPEAMCLLAGGLTGYMIYDLTHYYLHHSGKPWFSYLGDLKTYHLAHHYKNHHLGYGITSKLWDVVFGTVLDVDGPVKAKGA